MENLLSYLFEDLASYVGDKLGVGHDEVKEVFEEYMNQKTKLLKTPVKQEKPKKTEEPKEEKVKPKTKETLKASSKDAPKASSKDAPKASSKTKPKLIAKKSFPGLILGETGLVYDRENKEFYGRLDEKSFNAKKPEKSVMPLSAKDIEYCVKNGYSYRIPEDGEQSSSEEEPKKEEPKKETKKEVKKNEETSEPQKETKKVKSPEPKKEIQEETDSENEEKTTKLESATPRRYDELDNKLIKESAQDADEELLCEMDKVLCKLSKDDKLISLYKGEKKYLEEHYETPQEQFDEWFDGEYINEITGTLVVRKQKNMNEEICDHKTDAMMDTVREKVRKVLNKNLDSIFNIKQEEKSVEPKPQSETKKKSPENKGKQEESDSESDSDSDDDIDKATTSAQEMTVDVSKEEFQKYEDCVGKGTKDPERIKKNTGLDARQIKYIQDNLELLKKHYKK